MTHTLSWYQPNRIFLKRVCLLCGFIWTIIGVQAQDCTNKITAESGTQYFSCTEVTVSSGGYVGTTTQCNIGPYWIGAGLDGSYTFAFSPPVAGVTLDFTAMDYHAFNPDQYEIVTLDINGAPFSFPDAGVVGGCLPHAIVNASGGLQASPLLAGGSCKGIQILTPISSITLTDTYYNGNVGGVVFSIYFCCTPCEVRAGLIPSSPLNLCPDELAIVPPAAPNILPSGTMLEYILFSDPSDTLGSILFLNETPSFAFDPAVMQEGIPYYITAIAGNQLNGHVDLSDRCLDISDNAIPATWWPKPTVVFSTNDPDVCQGECFDAHIEFSGEPPFMLTYSSTYSGQMTKTFFGPIGTIQLCVPGNVMPGDLNIQALKLTDKYCTCE